jgi:toxin ParE1/3/4
MENKRRYTLSSLADFDLENIFDYTTEQHGIDQAIQYVSSFTALFEVLSEQPKLGRSRPDIRPEVRSIPLMQHVVFYCKVSEEEIYVLRVLHGNQDLPTRFGNPELTLI